jgi:hypothetical protein
MSQFGHRKMDALSSLGSTIIFNVDKKDAGYLTKDLGGRVSVRALISLEVGEAVARIGTDVVKIDTPKPLKVQGNNSREKIILESRRRYYRSAQEVRKLIRRRWERWDPFPTALTSGDTEGKAEEFVYDEL